MADQIYHVNPFPKPLDDEAIAALRKLNPSYDPIADIENAKLAGGEPEGPPDPKENILNIVKYLHDHPKKDTSPGFGSTLKTLATHPLDAAMGAAGMVGNTVAAIPQQVGRITEAVNPFLDLPDQQGLGARLTKIGENIPLVGGIVQAGNQAARDWAQTNISHPAAMTPEQKVDQMLAQWGGAARSTLPIDEFKALASGESSSGSPLTAQEAGENMFGGLTKISALHGLARLVAPGVTPSAMVEALQGPEAADASLVKGARSSGEIAAAQDSVKNAAVLRGKALQQILQDRRQAAGVVNQTVQTPQGPMVQPTTIADLKGISVDEQASPSPEKISTSDSSPNGPIISEDEFQQAVANLPPELRESFGQQQLLNLPAFKNNVAAFVTSPVFKDYLKTYNKGENPIGDTTVKFLLNPDIAVPMINDLGNTFAASFSDIRKALAGGQERSAEYAGQVNQVYSQAIQDFHDATVATMNNPLKSVAERTEASLILRSLKAAKENTEPLTGWAKASNIGNQIERLRLSQMVSPIATMVGYSLSHGATAFWDTIDAANMAFVEGLKSGGNILQGKPADFNTSRAFGDLIGNYLSFVDRLGWQRQKLGGKALGIPAGAEAQIQTLYKSGVPLEDIASQYKFTRPDGTPDPLAVEHLIKGVPRRYLADLILNENPLIKQRFTQDIVFDGASTLFSHTMSLAAKGLEEAADAGKFDKDGLFSKASWKAALDKGWENTQKIGELFPGTDQLGQQLLAGAGFLTDALNIPHRAATMEFRKYFFRARLEAELRNLNLSLPDAIAEMRKKEFDAQGDVVPMRADLRKALINAEVHALKNTYSYNPEGGLLGGILKTLKTINKNLPLPATIWITPFPRFAVNNLLWQTQHSPVMWFDMFNPEFRAKLYDAAENGAASREAQRSLARATTGLALVNSAYAMAAGHKVAGWRMGPKPTLLTDDSKDKNGNLRYLDANYFKPYSDYLRLGHIIHATLNNEPINMSPDEWSQFIIDSRVSDIALFNIGSTAHTMGSANEDVASKPVEEAVGDYLGSWLVFWKGLRNEGQALQSAVAQVTGHPEQIPHEAQPTLDHSPFSGPSLAAANPTALPPKQDPYTKSLLTTESPILKVLKLEQKPITPFQELIMKTPGVPPITPDYGSAEANNLVRKYEGRILQNPQAKIGDLQIQQVAKTLLESPQPEFNLMFLKTVLQQLHQQALQNALEEATATYNKDKSHPWPFADYAAKKEARGLPGMQEYIRLWEIKHGIK